MITQITEKKGSLTPLYQTDSGQITTTKPITNTNLGTNTTPTTQTTTTSTPGIDMAAYNKKYDEVLNSLEGNVNDYIGALQNIAQGDYDFTAKWIEANYKEALGNDDTKRADFFKSVANDLEKNVGRIAYDYQTGSYRLTQNRDLALNRLKEDNAVLTRDLGIKKQLAQEQQNTSLNQRGLMDSGNRQNVQGIAQRDIGQMTQDYQNQFDALSRSLDRGTQDINQNYTFGQEDLTTQARRAGEDAQQAQTYQSEQATRALESEQQRLEAQKKSLLLEIPGLASAQTNREYGIA